MRKIVFLFCVVFLATAARAADEPGAPGAPTLLVLGDSLSAGYGINVDQSWVALLQARLETNGYEHRVVNASISGETTEGGAERIGDALDRFGPSVVVIELGGNDGLRGLPPARMRANLEKMITESQAAGADVVLLGIRIPPNYGQRYTRAFEGVFKDLAEQYELPWIDFFMDGVALNDDLMQADGIHPSAEAQPLLLDNAWPVIEVALQQGS